MYKFIKQIFQLRLALPSLLLFIGVILFFAHSFDWFGISSTHKTTYKIIEKAGDLILISSVITFLIDSVEFLGVFKRELEEIIYDTKFLEKRNDIDKIWVKVSKVLFQAKFPQISEKLMMAVKNYYQPDEDLKLSYYKDYRNTYTIKYDEEKNDFIKVESKTSFQLNVEDSEEFDFPMRYWTCVKESEQGSVDTIMESVTVNGDKIKIIDKPQKSYENGMICFSFKIKLSGCTEYHVEQIIDKKYSLKQDNYLGFRARWLVDNIRVQIFHPEDMQILFVNRATAKDFKKNIDTITFKEYEYKGLILKHQGYIIILNKKTQDA